MLSSEPYDSWQPLAVGFLGASAHQYQSHSYVNCTHLLRTALHDFWAHLRTLLNERGLAPADMVLVYLLQSGVEIESGVLLSDGGRVYDFDLRCNRTAAGTESAVQIERWLDITDRWQTTPFSSEIADAFIWRPPSRHTILTAIEPGDQTDFAVFP